MSSSTYAIRGGKAGARRLDLLAKVMGPTTEALLEDAGVAARMHCADVGCGAGHVARSLAARVGSRGRVVGLDFDPVKLEAARRDTRRAGLGNVEFIVADVTTWSETAAYDAVYGRFIVSHLPGRPAIVARMAGALRPGGVLVLEDIDFTGSFCRPANAAFERYCELYTEVVGRRGGDANAGRDLYCFCLDAGLRDVRVRVVQPTHGGRPAEKELHLSTMVNIADNVALEGLATREELDDIIAELTAFTADPRTVLGCPRIFQTWGRKRGR
ncbi:MAG TPA: methyltransferase domain-containing protein [Gemmatimonadales bacterium]|nr:methyltransferase domain-containing protein [Gemmatimonadales bacterium]